MTDTVQKESLHNIISILKYPVISDKTTLILENNKYTFMVDKRANKAVIKVLIEFLFDVKVLDVNTLLAPPKKQYQYQH